MVPFAGYTITQYGQPTYALSGQLINGNHDIVLSHKATGDNVFANSYVAPIDVKNFTVADFDEGIERTFYLFNAGSWNQWNAGESDSTNLGGNGTVRTVASEIDNGTLAAMQPLYAVQYETPLAQSVRRSPGVPSRAPIGDALCPLLVCAAVSALFIRGRRYLS